MLSGCFPCYSWHFFSWVTYFSVSQAWRLLIMSSAKKLIHFMLFLLLLPFVQLGSCSARAEMVLPWSVHAAHGQRNIDKSPPKLSCPGSLVQEQEAPVQLSLRKVTWRLKGDDLDLHVQTELNWSWEEKAASVSSSSWAEHWLQVMVCMQVSPYSLPST